jgi:tetratricopeptide (TPR) repeat protein
VELFQTLLLKGDVIEHIRRDPKVDDPLRTLALSLAEEIAENPMHLNDAGWAIAVDPRRTADDYHRAVRYAEAACRLAPDQGMFLNTLGVARYRARQYRQALADLERSLKLNAPQYGGPTPADLAFLAMARHHLGQAAESRKDLDRLRDVMKAPRWAADAESKAFLAEATSLIDRPAGAVPEVEASTAH